MPLNRKSLCVNVGQTLPSANPACFPIFSQLLMLMREPVSIPYNDPQIKYDWETQHK